MHTGLMPLSLDSSLCLMKQWACDNELHTLPDCSSLLSRCQTLNIVNPTALNLTPPPFDVAPGSHLAVLHLCPLTIFLRDNCLIFFLQSCGGYREGRSTVHRPDGAWWESSGGDQPHSFPLCRWTPAGFPAL